MVDWSLLPYDLLADIALKLDEIEDFIYFSNVCRSWNCSSLLVKPKWNPRVPWLLLAENTKNNPYCYRKLFNPSRKRCYTLKLPQTFGARCWGSSCRWVVIFDLDLNLSLFNPLTRAQISLPPWTTLPSQVEYDQSRKEEDKNIWFRNHFICRAIVWRNFENDDLLVMAIHHPENRALAFARPGDQAWTYVPTPKDCRGVLDIVNWAGKIIILYQNHSLGCWDVSSGAGNLEPVPYLKAAHGLLHDNPWRFYALYLVESFGDLFMVLRHKTFATDDDEQSEETPYETSRFEVFRLNTEGKEWERVKVLGDVAFFVGDNCSISVPASDTNNYRSNCIYFTDDESQFWTSPRNFGGHDMGVFEIGSKNFETIYQGDDMRSEFCTPLWFMPNLSYM